VKGAKFRLQPVLELRRTEERTAALAAAQAANAAADADRRAIEREQALAGAGMPASQTSGAFLARMTLLRLAADDMSAARALATAQAQQAELVRAQWTAAAQRTKGLERLKERHLEAVRIAEAAAEERAVDDLVTGRAGRGAGQVADGADGSSEAREETPWTD
jgi:flagellar FliJ protein